MNRWILVQCGFIGSFDQPWSKWSRITDPDADHPKGTNPKFILYNIIKSLHIISSFIHFSDGPCALDFSKMKTPDSYWTDPSADELVQRHRIHSGLFQQTPAMTTSTSRPQLGARMSSYDENVAVAPLLAREHIDSLHQNSYAALLYGKNNVYLEPVSKTSLQSKQASK